MGRTTEPPYEWSRIELAGYLNAVLGVTTITPWGVGDIPEHWIETVIEGTTILAQLRERGLSKV